MQPFFCDVLLCDVKSHTALHQCQSFCDVLLSDVKSHTSLHQCQSFCDILLCDAKSHTCIVMWCQVSHHPSSRSSLLWCIVMWCQVSHLYCYVRPSLTPPFTKVKSFVMYCYVMSSLTPVLLCDVKSHTTLHQGQVSQFYLPVTRKYCFPTSFDQWLFFELYI